MKQTKKSNKLILAILFFGPLIFYLFLITGTNDFAKLPVLTTKVQDVDQLNSSKKVSLDDKISIVCFLGDDLLQHKTNALNLNEKIYKHFYGYKNFQMVIVLPKGAESKANQLKKELGAIFDIEKWYFVYGSKEEVQHVFNGLQTTYSLDQHMYTPYAFIVDRDMNLRGRNDDEDAKDGMLYGYFAEDVAPIHQKMVDDVKVLLAEYRRALKENKREI